MYVIDQWRRIGVTAEHQQLEVSLQKSTIANGQFQVALDAFCADSDDAKPLLVTYLSKARSPRNMARNKSPEIDALYDKFNAALTEADQKKLAGDLQRTIITESNSVPVHLVQPTGRARAADEGLEDPADPFRQSGSRGRMAGPIAGGCRAENASSSSAAGQAGWSLPPAWATSSASAARPASR